MLLKSLLGPNQLLNLSKLVIIIQALRVKQRPAWLNNVTRYDLLDWQLNLFHVDRCLINHSEYELELAKHRTAAHPKLNDKRGRWPTYRYLGRHKDILWHVSLGQITADRLFDLLYQCNIELRPGLHQNK